MLSSEETAETLAARRERLVLYAHRPVYIISDGKLGSRWLVTQQLFDETCGVVQTAKLECLCVLAWTQRFTAGIMLAMNPG